MQCMHAVIFVSPPARLLSTEWSVLSVLCRFSTSKSYIFVSRGRVGCGVWVGLAALHIGGFKGLIRCTQGRGFRECTYRSGF
jgi:hypothetical protein